jgi:hypothetical protein
MLALQNDNIVSLEQQEAYSDIMIGSTANTAMYAYSPAWKPALLPAKDLFQDWLWKFWAQRLFVCTKVSLDLFVRGVKIYSGQSYKS